MDRNIFVEPLCYGDPVFSDMFVKHIDKTCQEMEKE